MISVIITAFREPETMGRAIESFLPQMPPDAELLGVCPDPETAAVVDDLARRHPIVRHISDSGRGKPPALTMALQAARGDIVVLSDGDVWVADDALQALLAPFDDPQVGAVSGRPMSVNPRDTVLGYWSHLLTDAGAHEIRLLRDRSGEFLVCSGYLFAFRRGLIERVPEDALAEDAVISHQIAGQGYRIRYMPEARVFVKYPTTYRDWLRQRVRSAGGYVQDYIRQSPVRMRSARLEVLQGAPLALRYPRTLREWLWTLLLFAARLHLWVLVFVNVRLLKRALSVLWKRVETTK